MKCEYCDNEVPVGAMRCPSCGAMVSQHAQVFVSPQPGPEVVLPVSTATIGNMSAQVFSKEPQLVIGQKSKLSFVLLGIFLGEFGMHNFYLGYSGRGIAKLLITVLSFGWLCWISWIWGIVEVCTVRIDAKGMPIE